jgi:hypothetical protein
VTYTSSRVTMIGLRTAGALVMADLLGVDPANARMTFGDTSAPPQHTTARSGWASIAGHAGNRERPVFVAPDYL